MADGTRSEPSTQAEENLLTKFINYMRTTKGAVLCTEISSKQLHHHLHHLCHMCGQSADGQASVCWRTVL
ncbi:hypothetical protein AOLI_G00077920 [Acnodon oligacanthus]